MSSQSRLVAGVLLILLPTVKFGGASLLSLLIGDPEYTQNKLRQDLWRLARPRGVWLILSLVALRYVDEAALTEGMRWLMRLSFDRGDPVAGGLLPLGSLARGDGAERAGLPRLHRGLTGSGALSVGCRHNSGAPNLA